MFKRNSVALRKRGALWLLFLAPMFFITYSQVNVFTATRGDVTHLAFAWEANIPFLPWTIVPYWSLDLLYGLSFFICTSERELSRHGLRLLVASLVACIGFLLFPLQFSWIRPELSGVSGWLFRHLEQFDLPYNQAPSLHIVLSWLLWLRFRTHLSGVWKGAMSVWFILIAVSVLTTWQHHVVDVISGFAVALLIGYAIPAHGHWHWQRYPFPAFRLAFRYLAGAIFCLLLAWVIPFAAILLWPGIAMLLVALSYLGGGESIWQKGSSGVLPASVQVLLFPVIAVSVLSRRYFCRKLSPCDEVYPGIFIGYYPVAKVKQNAVLDLTTEFNTPFRWCEGAEVISYPLLDLQVPTLQKLHKGVMLLDTLQQRHPGVLVHCALGMSRSALITAGWLLFRGKAESPEHAIEIISRQRPHICLTPQHITLLKQFQEQSCG